MLQLPFGFHSTASDVVKGIDLHGKTMIVTGGASEIGTETTAALAAAGASVVIAARRPEAAEVVARDLRIRSANTEITVRPLDLSDLRSVSQFVDGWEGPIDALINNAGIMALPELQRTAEGLEMQFATNFLGHFALTLGLRRSLAMAKHARVVSVSSSGSLFGPVFWGDPHFRFIPYAPLLAYAQSKTACTLLSVGIAYQLADDGIVSNALNPGAIATNLQRHTGGLRTPEHLRKTLEEARRLPCSWQLPLWWGERAGDISRTAPRLPWLKVGRSSGWRASPDMPSTQPTLKGFGICRFVSSIKDAKRGSRVHSRA